MLHTKRVLNISEVRERLSDVRAAALHKGAIIHWGDRGHDELVTLASDRFRRLTERAAEIAEESGDAWAPFDAALAEGRLADSGDAEPRRRMPGVDAVSSVSWNDIPTFAGGELPPRRRPPATDGDG